jgi:hypothetical protein
MRNFLITRGVTHKSVYNQPTQYPSLPANRNDIDLAAPRFDYEHYIKRHEYNRQVAFRLAQLFISELPPVGARLSTFIVTADMHQVEAVRNSIYRKAENTRKIILGAGPAMEAARELTKETGRHRARKTKVHNSALERFIANLMPCSYSNVVWEMLSPFRAMAVSPMRGKSFTPILVKPTGYSRVFPMMP